MNSETKTGLQLMDMPHPERPFVMVPIFHDWIDACEHMGRHLLTQPECLAWAIVCPDYVQILDPSDSDARFEYYEKAKSSEGATAQELYDLYGRAIAINAKDAAKLKWVRSAGRLTVALGTDGILMLIEGVLTTAFLPGQGVPGATRESHQSTEGRGLIRERRMRSGRPSHRGELEVERERIARERREVNWTRAERLYRRVFRPAVQFVRSVHRGTYDMLGRVVRGDYALLKDVLPRQSQLAYDDWVNLRRVCGREA